MRKFLAVALSALVIAGPAAAAGQGNGSPLDGGLADHPALFGLCTAYFSGQGGEHGNKNSAPPFAALAAAADEAGDGNGEGTPEEIASFCDGVRPSNGQGQGKQDASRAKNPQP